MDSQTNFNHRDASGMIRSGCFTFLLLLLFIQGKSQQTISRTNEKVILESSRQTVSNYTKYIELIAQETDKAINDLYRAELYKSVERDSVSVYNDLVPISDRPSTLRENLDRLPTYLNDITDRYQEGVTLVYTDFQVSKVFIDTVRSRLFVKVMTNRSIDGTYFNKNTKKPNKSDERIDFYVSVEIKSTGVPESKIFSVSIHQENNGQFKPISVVEKTAPIEFTGIRQDTVYKRAMEHSITWKGGEIFERLQLDLCKRKNGQVIKVASIDSSFVNDNKLKFPISKRIKVGKKNKYFFRITKLSSEEQPIESNLFVIKRKTPILLQIGVPLLVVGGVVYLLLNPKEAAKDPILPSVPDPSG